MVNYLTGLYILFSHIKDHHLSISVFTFPHDHITTTFILSILYPMHSLYCLCTSSLGLPWLYLQIHPTCAVLSQLLPDKKKWVTCKIALGSFNTYQFPVVKRTLAFVSFHFLLNTADQQSPTLFPVCIYIGTGPHKKLFLICVFIHYLSLNNRLS